jgi:hypothetical protein
MQPLKYQFGQGTNVTINKYFSLILGKISINKDDVAFIFHQESLLFLYVTVSTVVSIPSCFVNC